MALFFGSVQAFISGLLTKSNPVSDFHAKKIYLILRDVVHREAGKTQASSVLELQIFDEGAITKVGQKLLPPPGTPQ